jgi:hypothetical protein
MEGVHEVVIHFFCHVLSTRACDMTLSSMSGIEYETAGYTTLMESLTHEQVTIVSN